MERLTVTHVTEALNTRTVQPWPPPLPARGTAKGRRDSFYHWKLPSKCSRRGEGCVQGGIPTSCTAHDMQMFTQVSIEFREEQRIF